MKICRFDADRLGLVEGAEVIDVTAALDVLPARHWPYPVGDALIAHLPAVRRRIEQVRDQGARKPVAEVTLRSPVANPSKICGAPVNYLKHLAEAEADPAVFAREQLKKIQDVGLFLKASSSLVGPGDGVKLRLAERRNDHELELGVVIGRPADRVSRRDALDHVAGYAIALDMTARGVEERSLRKSIDSYSVLGPWLVTADELGDPSALDLTLRVNGELRQKANTRDLVIDIPGLIEMASRFYTLHPGDIIMTGTPDGVGPVLPGDRMTAVIERVGQMEIGVSAG